MCILGWDNTIHPVKAVGTTLACCGVPTTDIREVKNIWRVCKTTKEQLERLHAKFKMLIWTMHIQEDNERQFVQELQKGKVQMGSNDSYCPNTKQGTHGHDRLELHNYDYFLEGFTGSPASNKDEMSSLPTEHFGMVAVLLVLLAVTYKVLHIEKGIIHLDNEEVTKRGNNKKTAYKLSEFCKKDYNLICLTKKIITELPIGKVVFKWIKGHQETTEENSEETQLITLNNRCNELARKAYTLKSPVQQDKGQHIGG